MAALYGGFLIVCQIALLWQGVTSDEECVYENLYTGAEFTKYCSYDCCEEDCCDEPSGDSIGTVIAGVVVGIAVFVFVFTLVICRVVASCPLARYRRAIVVRRTTIVRARPVHPGTVTHVPPSNFQNPLANPPVGVTVPQGPPPSYDQAVAPTFTPLPATVPVHQGPASNNK